MSFSRLPYDKCAYSQKIKRSVTPETIDFTQDLEKIVKMSSFKRSYQF